MLGESLGERFLCSAQPFLPNLCLFRPTYYSRAGVKYVYVTRLSPGRPAAGARFSATNNVRQLPEKIAFNYSCIMQTRRLRYEPMNHYTTYPRFSLACLEPPSPADINPKSDKTQKRSKLCMPVSLRPSRGRRERERERESEGETPFSGNVSICGGIKFVAPPATQERHRAASKSFHLRLNLTRIGSNAICVTVTAVMVTSEQF